MSDDHSPEGRLRESWNANAKAWAQAVREKRIESRRLGTDSALIEALVSRTPGRLLEWMHRQIKAALDPGDVLNPGKAIP